MDDKGSQGTDLTFNIFPMKNVNNQTRRPLNAKEKRAPDNSNKKRNSKGERRRENQNEKSTCQHRPPPPTPPSSLDVTQGEGELANNERGRRTHLKPKKKKKKRASCLENVNFMPNKVNERATSIYIPSP
jgi:hypothetical protein